MLLNSYIINHNKMKVGRVIIVGRPNSGKSTLINALLGQKISIVSSKPQTTRKIIQGAYWDERGQIIFLDTPGTFLRINDPVVKKFAKITQETLSKADVVLYLVDRSRSRGDEENRVLGAVRNVGKPKIMIINKIDIAKPNYLHEYKFLEDEFDCLMEISALKGKHLKTLLEKIFELLPTGSPIFDKENFEKFPGINLTPEEFVSEIIREKAFNFLQEELPYNISIKVEEITEKTNVFYIKATVFTTSDHYKPMIIGAGGRRIKAIGIAARQELELITSQKVFLDLEVVTNPHWQELLTN